MRCHPVSHCGSAVGHNSKHSHNRGGRIPESVWSCLVFHKLTIKGNSHEWIRFMGSSFKVEKKTHILPWIGSVPKGEKLSLIKRG